MTAQMIVSLVLEVLNRNLWISIALVVLILLCAILSSKAGLSVEHRLRVILTLSMALVWLLGLVICVGLTIRILPVVH